jgi:hypothetical protein
MRIATGIFRLAVILVAFMLTGCEDLLGKYVNAKFPPVNKEEQRTLAVSSTAKALERMLTPNIAASIHLPPLAAMLLTQEVKAMGVTAISLSGDDQLIEVAVHFKKRFSDADTADENLKRIFRLVSPEFEGSIVGYMGITSVVLDNIADPKLTLRLLPGVTQVKVEQINLPTSISPSRLADIVKNSLKIGETVAGNLLTTFFTQYRDNISGELSRQPFAEIDIQQLSVKPTSLTDTLKIPLDSNYRLSVASDPVVVPVRLDGVAWSVRSNRLSVLVQLVKQDAPLSVPVSAIASTPEAVTGQVEGHIKSGFGVVDQQSSTWIGVRKELIALTLNNVMGQAHVCGSAAGQSETKSSAKIPLPELSADACKSQRDCSSTRQCSFSASRDTRDCNRCLVHRPVVCAPKFCGFGGCIGGGCTDGGCAQYGNDPICEASKAAQNLIYDADANLGKADCDRIRFQEELTCRAEVTFEETACVAGRETLRALKRTGNFANIDTISKIASDKLQVCLKDFNLSPGLDSLVTKATVVGKANIDVDLKFTPLDIVGHLVCQLPWSGSKSFEAELVDPVVPLSAAIEFVVPDSQPAHMLFSLKSNGKFKANVTPSPARFFTDNPQTFVSCSGLALLSPLIVPLAYLLPQAIVDLEVKENIKMDLPTPKFRVGNQDIELRLRSTPNALIYSN